MFLAWVLNIHPPRVGLRMLWFVCNTDITSHLQILLSFFSASLAGMQLGNLCPVPVQREVITLPKGKHNCTNLHLALESCSGNCLKTNLKMWTIRKRYTRVHSCCLYSKSLFVQAIAVSISFRLHRTFLYGPDSMRIEAVLPGHLCVTKEATTTVSSIILIKISLQFPKPWPTV